MKGRLHTDGGARGNPGPAGIGVVLLSDEGKVIGEIARGIGVATNNEAEYAALIAGLELARDKGVTDVSVYCDSQLIVSQVKGEWKIKKEHLRHLAVKARKLLDSFETGTIEHVPREENEDADRLANQGMDAARLDADLDSETLDPPTLDL